MDAARVKGVVVGNFDPRVYTRDYRAGCAREAWRTGPPWPAPARSVKMAIHLQVSLPAPVHAPHHHWVEAGAGSSNEIRLPRGIFSP